MDSIHFLVTLIQKKDKVYKRPKCMHVSIKPNQSLYVFHQKILLSFNLPDNHYFAFYLEGQPFELLDFEWGGEGMFCNPVELFFRSLHHQIASNRSLSKDQESIDKFISDQMNTSLQNGSPLYDSIPLKDAHEILLEQCAFVPNQTFYFVYDFGDTFIFSIKVSTIGPEISLDQFISIQVNDEPVELDEFVNSLRMLLDTDHSSMINNTESNHIGFLLEQSKTSNSKSNLPKRKSNLKNLNPIVSNEFLEPNQSSNTKKNNLNSKLSKNGFILSKEFIENKIDELVTNFRTSYPDQFIDEIISHKNDEFAIKLLQYFNSDLRNHLPEFLLKRFFSSAKSFNQLCSLFLNQIQLISWNADNLFSGFLLFSNSLFLSDKSKYLLSLKYLSLTTLLLCLDCFDSDSLNKFLKYSENVLSLENFQQMAKFWDNANQLNNLQNLIKTFIEIRTHEIEKDEDAIFFTRISVYSKTSQKNLLHLLFSVYPEIITPIVQFILDPSLTGNNSIKYWILPIIELLAEYSDLVDFSDLVDTISTKTNYGEATSKLIIGIACWSISGNLQFIRNLKHLKASRVQTKIKKLLNDPYSYKHYLLQNRVKYWSQIQSFINDFSPNENENQLANDPKAIYIFEITLKGRKIIRTIAMEGKSSLHELHLCIQDFFDFDNDHLYGFYLDNNSKSYDEAYYSPQDDEEPSADNKYIFQCNFFVGMKFLYIFDFGDNWRFQIKVNAIRLRSKEEKEFPYLISHKGTSPQQYPDYEDDLED